MKSYLQEFYTGLDFPAEATASLLTAYGKLRASREANRIFVRYLLLYSTHDLFDVWDQIPAELAEAAKYAECNPRELELLFVSLLTPELRRRYRKAGYSEEMFGNAMLDLRCKAIECHDLYGVWGIFTFMWMRYWFHLRRFAFGRLQFELMPLSRVISAGQLTLERGDTVINVHIPSLGPLHPDEVLASYREAQAFFAPQLAGKPVVFHCSSWLLFPKHREILPAHSNILRFASDYALYDWATDPTKHDLWRIFYKNAEKPPHELPRSTSLERAYAELLEKGELPGWGAGVFTLPNS